MKIKVSHEIPKCLLDLSRMFNDFDFCLPHLLDQDEEYQQFFRDSKKMGRYIVMDNSLHELGEAYNSKRLLYWINELKPNEFIVPDVWMNSTKTLVNAKHWLQYDMPEETTLVAVVQGNNFSEARECYYLLKELGYKKIAISYGAEWYLGTPDVSEDKGKMLGRQNFIWTLYKEKIIKDTDRIHLLGCSLPQEFLYYKEYKFIESIDTSNPIMATLDGTSYDWKGLKSKPKSNMNNHLHIFKENIDMELLEYNIEQFRKINKL